MRTEPLPREFTAGEEPPTDIEFLMQTAWLLAGIAIAVAASACTVADEAHLRGTPAEREKNVAHLAPQEGTVQGNVQDMTY